MSIKDLPVVNRVLKKNFAFNIYPILFLFIGIFLGFFPLCLHKCNGISIFWGVYLILQTFIWFNLGLIFRKLCIAMFTDELTKLWNRRYLHIKLKDELKKLKRESGLSLAIIDIDNFKCINDDYGHLFSDKVLIQVADILQNNVRKSDIVSEWGRGIYNNPT